MREDDLIGKISQKSPVPHWLKQGIGDDAAWLHHGENFKNSVVTTDMLLDGVDFHCHQVSPELIGRKALAVNLSDIAAMAAVPKAAFVSLAIPRDQSQDWVERFYDGFLELAEEFGVTLAGGDTNVWEQPFAVSVTLIGSSTGAPVRRGGVENGDRIFITGALGGSIHGRHFFFKPRVQEALALHLAGPLRSMIDVSDGLATDLRRLLQTKQLGACLFADKIPVHTDVGVTDDAFTALRHAMCDGEDFELCLTVSPAVAEKWREKSPLSVTPLTEIGFVHERAGIWLTDATGESREIDWHGFEYQTADSNGDPES